MPRQRVQDSYPRIGGTTGSLYSRRDSEFSEKPNPRTSSNRSNSCPSGTHSHRQSQGGRPSYHRPQPKGRHVLVSVSIMIWVRDTLTPHHKSVDTPKPPHYFYREVTTSPRHRWQGVSSHAKFYRDTTSSNRVSPPRPPSPLVWNARIRSRYVDTLKGRRELWHEFRTLLIPQDDIFPNNYKHHRYPRPPL